MRSRYFIFLLLVLPLCAFAQPKLTIGPFVAGGTSGIQESLRISESEPFNFGNRLSRSFQLGLVARRSLGKNNALIGEVSWLNTETRFVRRFLIGNGDDFDEDQTRFRINGAQLAILFQQTFPTGQNWSPLLEFGLGIFLPGRVRTDNNSFDWRKWETVDSELVRSHLWRPIVGIGIQHQKRLFLSLRFSLVTDNLFERRPTRCFDFCPQEEDITRPRMGLNTQLLQLGYLF